MNVDVLVIGCGPAGASAAIAAHDAGASVLIVEKRRHGGGNALFAGGFLWDVGGAEAVRHVETLFAGKTDRSVAEAYVAGPGYRWSADNLAEVRRGWITRAGSPGELAARLGLDPAVLTETLTGFNAAAAAGRDDRFGRRAEYMAPLDLADLYAIELWPAVATTSGGPRRDAWSRVVRPDGTPVPGLYAAGGAGTVWGPFTHSGGGLTDALVFGQRAGQHAARCR